ncbi:MAG: hypothetical protein M0C28_32710 [Candidatus Moduliflexus flocculans]|nr:hypothetical protein [Candidatus Moduliflexus flocculans]
MPRRPPASPSYARLISTNIANYRRALGENQHDFWRRFGVTQSGGSRYESGRSLPTPVRILMSLYAHGKITDDDLTVAAGGKPAHKKKPALAVRRR